MVNILLRVVAGIAIAAIAGAIAIRVITGENIFDLIKKDVVEEEQDPDIRADNIVAAQIKKAEEKSVTVDVFFADLDVETNEVEIFCKEKVINNATADQSLVGELIVLNAG